jgi:hypothetical protein
MATPVGATTPMRTTSRILSFGGCVNRVRKDKPAPATG